MTTHNIQSNLYFGASVYTVIRDSFLATVKEVSEEFLSQNQQEVNEIYPVKMSGNMHMDPRLSDFCQFIATSSRAILDNQGYNIDLFNLYFTGMWAQEHHKYSGMEQHIHGDRDQIVGFYFLDVPEDSSRVLFHDPNSAKVITALPQKNMENATMASAMINYEPEEGQLFFTNAWLPHSITKNTSEKPLRFVHFNMGVELIPPQVCNTEII